MNDWTHGYDVSVGYIYGFYREMAPDWLDFCARARRIRPPRAAGAPFRYLDLGCGQGFHLCILAAANPDSEFVGIDFDPAHIEHGRQLASTAGLENIRFIQADFLDLAAAWPGDLGTFDYIVLQGILTWISADLRAAVVTCVGHASRQGTLAYFGYNVAPGWLSAFPFQHFAKALATTSTGPDAVDKALQLFARLSEAGAAVFNVLPSFQPRLDALQSQAKAYLVHEYLSDHWAPTWHSTIADELGRVCFEYAGPATVAEILLPNALPPPLRDLLADRDGTFAKDLNDIIIGQGFRRDIFVRSPAPDEAPETNKDVPIHLLTTAPPGSGITFETAFGTLSVEPQLVADIVDELAAGPRRFSELMQLKNPARLNNRRILFLMLHAHMLTVAPSTPGSPAAAERLNRAIARAACDGTPYRHVAAATLGSAIAVTELHLLVLDAWLNGARDAGAIADGVGARLRKLGRELVLHNSAVSDADTPAGLQQLGRSVISNVIPTWRSLGVIQ